ncbi:MAG: MBL fold metallo-hydrolase [Erysipelotrichaceae bacterium]|nr:MBL fold metallo-hydrolase [Erysipelotrichaceae bacterium]
MIEQVTVFGYISENCFFYIDDESKHGFLIDPGAQAEKLLAMIKENGWVIEGILLTHGHFDHIGAVNEIRDALHIPVIAFESADDYLLSSYANLSSQFNDEILVKDVQYVKEGDEIVLSTNPQFSLRVIYTPGHTTDSIVYYSENNRVLFSGDTIFKASIGNTRFPGGDYDTLVSSIINKIFTLPEDTVIYSGHSEPTSVGTEKRRYF